MSEIDFVIPWVDGNDPAWRRAFAEQRHADAADKDASAARHAAGEACDAVDVELEGVRVEGGAIGFRQIVGMFDYVQLRMIGREPFRQMAPRDEVDAPHPRSEPLGAAEPVA